jgi:hypothetical protein
MTTKIHAVTIVSLTKINNDWLYMGGYHMSLSTLHANLSTLMYMWSENKTLFCTHFECMVVFKAQYLRISGGCS